MLKWIEQELIRVDLLVPSTLNEAPMQFEINAKVCFFLASIVLIVTIFRPLLAELPVFFLIAGYINSALLFTLWRLIKRPTWQPYGAVCILGLCLLMLLPLLLLSGGANSHYSPIAPLFPLFAILMGSVSLAVVFTFLWSAIWVAFYFFGVSDLDLTVSYWHEGKTASRTLWLILCSFMILLVSVSFENRQRRLQQSLFELSLTDPLTQVGNRRAMEQTLAQEMHLTQRTHEPFTVMMIDVDHFKKFNDLRGHDGGDKALQRVAQCLTQLAREGQDSVARFGGEEFIVILRHTSATEAMAVAEKYRQGVKALQLTYQDDSAEVLTITIGLADSSDINDSESLLKQADSALYVGKRAGRDCVINAASLVNHSA
ncbi:GGDEF domain-containing protein [Motilimonas sp. KMU-193]|uniref:GGDEF domain-containing protein n=1 Tax=Motilimonas sp. KMU-193 TaxID=3388668 RepID=UPI00396B1E91